MAAAAASVSSVISPTTSSTMSSTVTIPTGAAVLVDDDGHRGAIALHVGEQVIQPAGLGDHRRGTNEVHQRLATTAAQRPREVVDVDDSGRPTVAQDGRARVAGVDAAIERRFHRVFGIGGHDRRHRGHHAPGVELARPEYAGEHLRLLRAPSRRRQATRRSSCFRSSELVPCSAAAFAADPQLPEHGVGDIVERWQSPDEKTRVNTSSGPATRRATVSAFAMANIFGTCSPTVMCAAVEIT